MTEDSDAAPTQGLLGGQSAGDLLAEAVASVAAAIYVIDVDGLVLAASRMAEQLLGYRGHELLGQRAHQSFHALDATGRHRHPAACPIVDAARTATAASETSDVFVRKDGSLMPVTWRAEPVVVGQLRAAVIVFEDVTLRPGASPRDDPEHAGAGAGAGAAPLRGASRAHDARVAFLADVTSALGSTLDAEEALVRLARLIVPRFADWCVMEMLADGQVERVSVAHHEPHRVIAMGEDAELSVPMSAISDPVLARVLQGGPGALTDTFPDPMTAPTEIERRRLAVWASFEASSALVVGLRARRSTLGAFTLVRSTKEWPYEADDLIMAEDIARRAAMAIDNARLYREQRSTAEALQRSLLPDLDYDGHLDLCATYLPAQQGVDIGGDWYDSFVLPDGVTAMVLGDVAGHDLAAAVAMSSIRNLLRGAALHADDPADVLRLLDEAMAQFTPNITGTAIFARVETTPEGNSQLRWSNAGHPPPLLVGADGSTRYLDSDPDLLLGADPSFSRSTLIEILPAGSTVLFYSDGLVEDRRSGIEPGMTRLRRGAANLVGSEPMQLCEQLVEDLGRQREDDIAIIALRVGPDSPVDS